MKTCSRCGKVKTAVSFKLAADTRDGRGSHCRECRNESNREWKRENPHNVMAGKIVDNDRRSYDPFRYAKLHCEHIASYAEKAIQRFESRTKQECPPQLTAILQLARTAASAIEIEPRFPARFVPVDVKASCSRCSAEFEYRATHWGGVRCYCDRCRVEIRQIHNRRGSSLTYEELAERRRVKREQHQAASIASKSNRERRQHRAAYLRAEGLKWKDIASELGYASPGAAHNAAAAAQTKVLA